MFKNRLFSKYKKSTSRLLNNIVTIKIELKKLLIELFKSIFKNGGVSKILLNLYLYLLINGMPRFAAA
jgi:hypothetical protein